MTEDRRTRELEVLAESSQLLTSTLDLDEVLERLAGIGRRRLEVDVVRIWLLEESGDALRLRGQQGASQPDLPGHDRLSARDSLSGWVITHRTPLVLADAARDPRLHNREWFMAEGLVSLLVVPIMLDQNPLGIITFLSRKRREFTEADVALAQALAAPAVAAVRNAALYSEALARLKELLAFQRVVSETLSSPALETALNAVVREARALLGSDAAMCSVFDAHQLRMRTVAMSGARSDGIPGYSPGGEQGGLASLVLVEKRAMRTDDYLGDPRFVRPPAVEAWARTEGLVTLIAVPVLDASREVIALLWAFNRSPVPFTLRHEATLSSLATQAAVAIDKARAFEEERRRARQTAALLDIARACTSTLELTPLLRDITCRTASALGAERCAIFLWRDGHLVPVMAQFADGHEDPELWTRFKALREHPMEDVPAHAEAIRHRRPVEVTRDAGLLPAEWFDRLGLGSALIVPLVSSDQVVGTMGLDVRTGRAWSEGQVELATTIAAQVALAVDNARHYRDARQRATEVETLAAIGETLASTLDAQKVLEGIADSAGMLTAARRAIVFELDPDKGCLSARAVRGLAVEPGFTLRLGEGVVGHAALNREPVWSDDVLARPFAGQGAPSLSSGVSPSAPAPEYGGRAILAAPVISRDTVLGAVCVCWDEVHAPDEREIRMLSALARQAAIAMENARLVGDLRHTLDELRAAQETLIRGATLRAVGELAAGAAHHLNNLLAVILGRTQLLLMKRPEPSIADNLRSVERAAVDAADTVRRIQGFSGTTKAGKAARFDLNVVVREVMEFTRPRWQNDAKVRGATIEMLTQPGQVPAVFGQHLEISEALTNLVLNAADALPEGGRITIATRAEGERVFVSVRDTGTGMSAEVKRRAFEPFFTTKGVKRTGLGLAVAYGTVQRHGGQISIESEPGAGTTVTLWLPAATQAEAPIPVSDDSHAGRVGSVLVIDDETDVRDLVVDVLRSRGHHITAATGGREGLERFEAGRYDVVLTDLGMPEVNGWEVARAVKTSGTATSVLLLTGWADAMDADSASLVDGVLRKPFGVDQLAAAVAAALAAR